MHFLQNVFAITSFLIITRRHAHKMLVKLIQDGVGKEKRE
jgi:hypothetical protein